MQDLYKTQIILQGPKIQNGSSHHVSRIQIITKMGSETILKNKKFCRDQKQFFFYKDQNLNEAYLQGRVQYLSQKCIKTGFLNKLNFTTHIIDRIFKRSSDGGD